VEINGTRERRSGRRSKARLDTDQLLSYQMSNRKAFLRGIIDPATPGFLHLNPDKAAVRRYRNRSQVTRQDLLQLLLHTEF